MSTRSNTAKSRSSKPAKAPGVPGWAWLVLLAAAVFAYLPALNGPFVFDDLTSEPLNPEGSPSPLILMRSSRPIYYLSLWLDRTMFGLEAFPLHAINLFFHLLSACMVVLVLKRLAGLAGVDAARARNASLFLGGAFLLHPVLTEGVSYIASRSEVLSIFFGLASMAVFLGAKEIGAGRAMAVLALFALAAGSKEHSFAYLPVMVLAVLWFEEKPLEGLKARAMLFVPLVVGGLAGAAYIIKTVGTQSTAGFGMQGVTPLGYLATQCQVIWRYVVMFAIPHGMNIDHGLGFASGFAEPASLAGGLSLACVTAAAVIYRRRFPIASFGWLAFLILLAPTSSIIPIADPMTDRRLYIGSLGLLIVALEWVSRAEFGSTKTAAGALAVLCVLGALTYQRNKDYSSPEALWSASVQSNPQNARARFQLAHAYYSRGACSEASDEYAQAFKLGQKGADLLVDWALALDCKGDGEQAVERLNQAAAKDERSFHAYSTLGMILGKQNRLEEAIEALNKAIEKNGSFAMSYAYRGNVLFLMGRKEEATADFRKALSLDPNNAAAQQGLAATMR